MSSLQLPQLRLEGGSRAGDATWFRVHPPGLALDVGRGALELAGAADVFLTHGHLDHALGLPFLLSYRTLHRSQETRVFAAREIAPAVESFVQAAAALEGVSYRYQLHPLDPGDRVAVGNDLAIEAFAVSHVVPALGYHLLRTRRSLAEEFRGRSADELALLRRSGVSIDQEHEEVWLSYPGDTDRRVFDLEPRLVESRILLLECTFVAAEHRDRGERYGHLHLDDLAGVADRLHNEVIVLSHLSRRHSLGELRRAVDVSLPRLAERVRLVGGLGEEWDPQ